MSWYYSFLLFHPHENGCFWPFFTIQSQRIEQTILWEFFILKVFWCSNNLMQKLTSITPTYKIISHLKVFFKYFAQKFELLSSFQTTLHNDGSIWSYSVHLLHRSLHSDSTSVLMIQYFLMLSAQIAVAAQSFKQKQL